MHARDASGRQVSLLNDDSASSGLCQHDAFPHSIAYRSNHVIASHAVYGRSPSPFPNTPELLRSDSYDSQTSSEPISPLTPMYDYGRVYVASGIDARSSYDDYMMSDMDAYVSAPKRPSGLSDSRSTSYEDDTAASPSASNPGDLRASRRYPCRYRDTHGCEKTFTTSGHASRHSKIHTAEKAVQCTFPGCAKKFTRADNMKQHLETHYKDKSSRSSTSRPPLVAGDSKSSSGKSSSRSKTAVAAAVTLSDTIPLPSPGLWEVRNGLDALALAVACQEGA